MKKTFINILKFIVFFSIGIALLYFAFKGINFSTFWESIKGANYTWVAITLVVGWVAFLLRAHRWNLLLEPMGYKSDTWSNYHAVAIGYLANFAFPRIGEIVRCGTLSKTKNIPVDKLVGTVMTERIIDLVMLFLCLFAVLIIKFDFFGSFINARVVQPIALKFQILSGISYIFWLLAAAFIALTVYLIVVFKQRLKKITLVKKIGKLAKGILEGILSVFKMKRKLEFILYTLLIWFMYYLMGYLMFFSLPATSHLSPVDGLFILVVGSLGMSAPVQGGFGVFHVIVASALMLFGISYEDEGLVYAVITHESQALLCIVAGSYSFFYLYFASKKNKNIENTQQQ